MTTDRMPARAAAAATALARLPVDGQARTLNPISVAAASATATTRSLNVLGGVAAVALTPHPPHPELLGQPVGADQPGVAGVEGRAVRDVRRDRQQRGVAPDVLGPGLDVGPGQPGEVVAHLQRPETLGTGVERTEGNRVSALPAGQAGGVPEAWRGVISHGARPLSPIFPSGHPDRRTDLAPGARWPRLTEVRYRAGCRGFVGPFPPPLWMRSSVVMQCFDTTVTDQANDPGAGRGTIHLRLRYMTNDPSRLLIVASNRGPVSYGYD